MTKKSKYQRKNYKENYLFSKSSVETNYLKILKYPDIQLTMTMNKKILKTSSQQKAKPFFERKNNACAKNERAICK